MRLGSPTIVGGTSETEVSPPPADRPSPPVDPCSPTRSPRVHHPSPSSRRPSAPPARGRARRLLRRCRILGGGGGGRRGRCGPADEMPTVQAGEPELPVTFTGDDGVEITVESLERVMVVDDGTIEIIGALGRADLLGIAPEVSLLEDVASQAEQRITTA